MAALKPADAKGSSRLLVPEGVEWDNRLSARVLSHIPFYRPITFAPRIQCPLLVCVGKRDQITSPQAAIKTAQVAPRAEVRQYDSGHFDVFVGEIFEQVVSDECDFLARHLLAKDERYEAAR